jgi:hypothetical protein
MSVRTTSINQPTLANSFLNSIFSSARVMGLDRGPPSSRAPMLQYRWGRVVEHDHRGEPGRPPL